MQQDLTQVQHGRHAGAVLLDVSLQILKTNRPKTQCILVIAALCVDCCMDFGFNL